MLTGTSLLPLQRADGSATYSAHGFSVLAAVNGPVEVQRRDELPNEATVDVVVRPAAGVGSVRERHLESILHKALRHIILVSAHPRKLIQVTLQVTGTPGNDSISVMSPQGTTYLPILPALLQAAILALLSTSIPLAEVYTSTLIAVDSKGSLLRQPSPKDVMAAHSLHVFAFSSHNRILVAESEGFFDIDFWETIVEEARQECRGDLNAEKNTNNPSMDTAKDGSLEGSLRHVLELKLAGDRRWKEDKR